MLRAPLRQPVQGSKRSSRTASLLLTELSGCLPALNHCRQTAAPGARLCCPRGPQTLGWAMPGEGGCERDPGAGALSQQGPSRKAVSWLRRVPGSCTSAKGPRCKTRAEGQLWSFAWWEGPPSAGRRPVDLVAGGHVPLSRRRQSAAPRPAAPEQLANRAGGSRVVTVRVREGTSVHDVEGARGQLFSALLSLTSAQGDGRPELRFGYRADPEPRGHLALGEHTFGPPRFLRQRELFVKLIPQAGEMARQGADARASVPGRNAVGQQWRGWNPVLRFRIRSAQMRGNCKAAAVNVVCSAPVKDETAQTSRQEHATRKDHCE